MVLKQLCNCILLIVPIPDTRYFKKKKKLIKYYKVRYSCHFVTQINKNTVTLNCRLEQLLQDFTRKK